MVVDEAAGLHERVADRRPHEPESAPLQLLRHRRGLGGSPPGSRRASEPVHLGCPSTNDQQRVERPLLVLHAAHGLGVGDGRPTLARLRTIAGFWRRRSTFRLSNSATFAGSKPEKAFRYPRACSRSSTTTNRPARLRGRASRTGEHRRDRHAPFFVVVREVGLLSTGTHSQRFTGVPGDRSTCSVDDRDGRQDARAVGGGPHRRS